MKKYEVTFCATLLYAIKVEVEAENADDAVRFAKAREDANGLPIYEASEEFLETLDEDHFEAKEVK